MILLLFLAVLSTKGVPLPDMPDSKITPGVSRNLTKDEICSTKWGTDARAVTSEMKADAFTRYGLSGNEDCPADSHGRRCEVDHKISREIGGADDINNLWPQHYSGDWNASDKDRLENWAHKQICENGMSISDAQHLMDNWEQSYIKAFGGPPQHNGKQ